MVNQLAKAAISLGGHSTKLRAGVKALDVEASLENAAAPDWMKQKIRNQNTRILVMEKWNLALEEEERKYKAEYSRFRFSVNGSLILLRIEPVEINTNRETS